MIGNHAEICSVIALDAAGHAFSWVLHMVPHLDPSSTVIHP